jgi:RNA-directed DNA polymerase
MMNGAEKSDSAIRAKKPANKAGRPAAEWVEQRAGTKGNTGQPHTRRTQSRASVSQRLDRVRQAARQRKKERFTALLHHVTVGLLREAFYALKRRAAPGVDGLRWPDYEADLEEKLSRICTHGSNAERTGHCRSGDGTYRSRAGSSARWGSLRWRTKSSNVQWSRC